MNRRRLINWLCCLFLSMNYVHAQSPHWECNISDYEYDMTMYLNLQIDGQMVVNHDGYEIAAFCGDECRGVATVEKIDGIADATYYYLRVRSNLATGDNFSIKGYEKDSKKEFDIDGSVEFVSQSVIGYPSSPSILEYKNTYRIAFVVDGNLMSEYSLLWGSEVTIPEIPTKEGHTFSGWSDIPTTMPAEDVAVEGTFTVNRYRLVYLLDGVEYSVDSIAYGTELVQKDALAKEGYTFSGWSELPATMPAEDVTVEGTFTVNRYTIIYKVDGEVYATEEIAYGEVIVLKEEPVKEGYIFGGWSDVPETMPAKNIEVTGHFEVDGIDIVLNNRLVDVYTLQGIRVKRQVLIDNLENELSFGIYIINGKKVMIK